MLGEFEYTKVRRVSSAGSSGRAV